jgi:2-dehydropantoate 2-reductase
MGNDLPRGNRLKLPWFAGKVVEFGRRHGVPTPVNGFVCAALEAIRQRASDLVRPPT